MIKILRKKSFIISAIIIVLIIASFFILRGDKTPEYDSVIAEKGTITEEVSVTGRVKPAQSVNLAPEQTGQVSDVSVAVGDKVWLGKTLIQLRNDELLAQLLQLKIPNPLLMTRKKILLINYKTPIPNQTML